VTTVDLVALVFVAFTALLGLRKGLIAAALSLAGVVAGAILGARVAPHLLHGGSASPWTPLAGLVGAAFGAILLETAGALLGGRLRRALPFRPLLSLDSAGGLAIGAAAGLALVWVVGASALLVPGQTELRRAAQKSLVLQQLYDAVPPSRFMRLLARVDPFPAIAGPAAPVEPPDPRLMRSPSVRRAAPSVVRVLGTACGLRVTGSGWVARSDVVVTAAHVVAGETDTVVEPSGAERAVAARVVAFDAHNDLAVLRVPGLALRPLPIADPHEGRAVAIVGYPENGPLSAVPGRLGPTAGVLTENAYGHGPVARTITSVRGRVRHGDSGGPTIDARGAVETTVFAARIGSEGGFGVPSTLVRNLLRDLGSRAVSTGACAA
jgi:S1-C subfamily serine protease